MRHSQPHLPTELLREIIMIVLVEYLDDIIPDVFSIRNFRLDDSIIPDEVNLTFQGTKQLAKQQIERDGFVVPDPHERNHFLPLLQTSHRIREIALSVASDAFYIPRTKSKRQ